MCSYVHRMKYVLCCRSVPAPQATEQEDLADESQKKMEKAMKVQ